MDNKLLAIVSALVDDAIKKIELREGPAGPRGLKGRDGNDFRFEDHRDQIVQLILQNIPKNFELTEEQIIALKGEPGPQGPEGAPGADGRDGRDFVFEEHVEVITEIIKAASLKFEDFTPEQIEALRGPKGEDGLNGRNGRDGRDFDFLEHQDRIAEIVRENLPKFEDFTDEQKEELRGPQGEPGRDGRDFDFAESQDKINDLLINYLNEIRDTLKLKFDDLTEDHKASLRGPRGQRGKPGRDFDLEESLPTIKNSIRETVQELKEELKFKSTDFSAEELESFKLTFDKLTVEEKMSLRGPRGQRGKMGIQGEQGPAGRDGVDGKDGRIGPRGIPGLTGAAGRDGRDGQDGKDAPRITDVEVEQNKKEFNLVFKFDDGTEIKSEDIKIPQGDTVFYYPAGFSGGSGSGGGSGTPGADGKSAYEIAVENGFVGTEVQWLASLVGPQGPAGNDGADGTNGTNGADGADGASAYEIAVANGFVGDETAWLASLVGPQGPAGNDGADGADGASAYEIAVANGFVGTEAEWLQSLEASGSMTIKDEYTNVSTAVTDINFIGEYIKVRPRVTLDEWAVLADVTSLSEWPGYGGNPSKVDVYVDITDPSIIKDVDCDPTVFVGAFVRMTNAGVAVNAQADSYANSNVLGVVEYKGSSTKCHIRISGRTANIFTGLDTVENYFLSATTPGGKEIFPATASGQVKLPLGQAFSSSSFLLSKGERVVRA